MRARSLQELSLFLSTHTTCLSPIFLLRAPHPQLIIGMPLAIYKKDILDIWLICRIYKLTSYLKVLYLSEWTNNYQDSSPMPNSLQTNIRNFFKKVNLLTKVNNFKRTPLKKSCVLDFNSSFIAMDVSNQLKQVFKFFDIDGDGKISTMELTNVLLTFDHEKSKATIEAQGILKEVDFNGDGFIDLDEFMTIMDSSKPLFATSKEEDDGDLKNVFMVFDIDKDGLISPKELQRVLISLGCSNSRLGKCRKMIKGVDKNGDGFVDFEEFKSMMSIGIN